MRLIAKIFITIYLNCLFTNLTAQFNIQSDRENIFVIPKLGLGVKYGAIGSGIDIGAKNFSASFNYGYHYAFKQDEHTIDESYNINYGLSYYFKGSEKLKIKTGVNIGWVENYYEPQIANDKYNPNIQGITFNLGAERYFDKFFMEIGLTVGHGKLTFNGDHPHYSRKAFISPYIGILYKLPSIYISERYKVNPKTEKRKCLAISQDFFDNMEENNTQTYLTSCKNINIVYQLPEDKTMIINFKLDSLNYSSECITTLIGKRKAKYINLYIFDNKDLPNPENICDNFQELIEDNQHLACSKGRAFVYFEKTKTRKFLSKRKLVSISIKLNDLKFENNYNKQLYLDEIILWDVKIQE